MEVLFPIGQTKGIHEAQMLIHLKDLWIFKVINFNLIMLTVLYYKMV